MTVYPGNSCVAGGIDFSSEIEDHLYTHPVADEVRAVGIRVLIKGKEVVAYTGKLLYKVTFRQVIENEFGKAH